MDSELVKKVAKKFSIGEVSDVQRLNSGLVNISHLVQSTEGRFVLQELSPIWDERVIDDYMAVQRYLRTNGLHVPVLLINRNGKPFQKVHGKIWRAFEYQDNDSVEEATPELAREAGALLGRFHGLMRKSDFKPSFTLPGFHDTPGILKRLESVYKNKGNEEKARRVKEEYEFLSGKIPSFYLPTNRQKTVIHGDPKLANFLFKDGKAVSLLDLDTMMVESPLFDLGDALRSWCRRKPASSEYIPEIFEEAMRGYESTSPFHFTYQGINNAMSLITLELAARYLIDFFEERYFAFNSEKYQSRAEQNLTRCRRYVAYQREFERDFGKFHVAPFMHGRED